MVSVLPILIAFNGRPVLAQVDITTPEQCAQVAKEVTKDWASQRISVWAACIRR